MQCLYGFPEFCFGFGSILVLKMGDFSVFLIFNDEEKPFRTKKQKLNIETDKTKRGILGWCAPRQVDN